MPDKTRRSIVIAAASGLAVALTPMLAAGQEQPVPKRYRCTVCDHVYNPAEGDPASGIAPGTPFENLPEDWVCPECGARKGDFEPID